MVTVLPLELNELVTAMSIFPSPLKSPTATDSGPSGVPTANWGASRNCCDHAGSDPASTKRTSTRPAYLDMTAPRTLPELRMKVLGLTSVNGELQGKRNTFETLTTSIEGAEGVNPGQMPILRCIGVSYLAANPSR